MAEVLEKDVTYDRLGAITVPGSTETLVLTSGRVIVPTATAKAHVRAWMQIVTSINTTHLILRIRRGTGLTGTIISSPEQENIAVTAGDMTHLSMEATDEVSGVESVQYVATIQEIGATGNGTTKQACIAVELLNG